MDFAKTMFQMVVIVILVGFLCRLMDLESRVDMLERSFILSRKIEGSTKEKEEEHTETCDVQEDHTETCDVQEDHTETFDVQETIPEEAKLITSEHLTPYDEKVRKMSLERLCQVAEEEYDLHVVNEKTGKKKSRQMLIREILAKI